MKTIIICIDGVPNYFLDRPELAVPNMRTLREEGTRACFMKSVYPSVTWPATTSIVTGCLPGTHGVVGNLVYDKEMGKVYSIYGDKDIEKETLMRVPALYDLAAEKGLVTGAVCWPVTKGARNIAYNIPEFYEQALFEAHGTPGLWSELLEAGLPMGKYGDWSREKGQTHMQDWLSTEVGKYLLKEKQPDLLLMHYLSVDSSAHYFGGRSPDTDWCLSYVDQLLGELLESMSSRQKEETNLFVMSDHGCMDVQTDIHLNSFFEKKGWYQEGGGKNNKVTAVSNGTAFIYIKRNSGMKEEAVLSELKQMKGIRRVYCQDDFTELGLGNPEELWGMPDLIAEPEIGYNFDDSEVCGEVYRESALVSSHGFEPDREELKAFFLAKGPSIRKGYKIPAISMTDVAPTIGAAMGLQFRNAEGNTMVDGTVLSDIFSK